MKLIITLTCLLLLLSGCLAGDGEGLDERGQPIVPDNGQTPAPDTPNDPGEEPADPSADDNTDNKATLAFLQEEVLTPICAQCHFGNNAPVGLRMDSLDASADNLLNSTAVLNPQFQRVEPGDAENSFLYLKIVGDPVAGNRMPLGLSPLPEDIIEIFRTWINNGAPIDSSQARVGKVEANATTSNYTVNLLFDQPMNTHSLVTEQIFISAMSIGTVKTSLLPGQDYLSSWKSNQQLEISIQQIPQGANQLFIYFNDDSTSTAVARNGALLDGDDDGQPGGVYQYEITL